MRVSLGNVYLDGVLIAGIPPVIGKSESGGVYLHSLHRTIEGAIEQVAELASDQPLTTWYVGETLKRGLLILRRWEGSDLEPMGEAIKGPVQEWINSSDALLKRADKSLHKQRLQSCLLSL